MSAIPDGIFQIDIEGTFANYIPSWEFTPQILPEDFVGKRFEKVLPADLAEMYRKETAQLFDNGRMRIFEYAHRYYFPE